MKLGFGDAVRVLGVLAGRFQEASLSGIAFYLFWPLIQIDLYILRFYKDSVLVMLALKGFKYMDSARRVEGLLNRSRGKIPHLTKFTSRTSSLAQIFSDCSSK